MAEEKIVNGVNVDQLYSTIDAIKDKPKGTCRASSEAFIRI